MTLSRKKAVVVGLALCAMAATLPASEPINDKDSVRIGLVSTLFRDIPPSWVQMTTKPFSDLMKEQTGLAGKVITSGAALDLGRQLQDGKVQLGVFHGVEFAWAQERYPNLEPLMIAVNRERHLHANLVVRWDCTAKDFGDLKGKILALPRRSREHCHLFLERHCRELGMEPKEYFDKVVCHGGVEDALDDVIRGKVQGAIVDSALLEWYGRLKPGCHSGLKIVKRSEVFPAAVIVYRKGALDDATLQRFRKGMLDAHQNTKSNELMRMWSLTGFERIPEDYQQTLTDIRKAYPAPEAAKTPPMANAKTQ
jgi:ABC-type phosphate/phosphonate transport system substrate-binding protein